MPLGMKRLQRAFFGNNLTLQNYGAKIVNNNELEGDLARFISMMAILNERLQERFALYIHCK
jgi:hypothetical protein